jgi:hypothetical protein
MALVTNERARELHQRRRERKHRRGVQFRRFSSISNLSLNSLSTGALAEGKPARFFGKKASWTPPPINSPPPLLQIESNYTENGPRRSILRDVIGLDYTVAEFQDSP